MATINPAETWAISDTHFGHENIKGFCHRPQDVEQIMMEEWARAVSDSDTVLHLGDLSWKSNAWFRNMIAKHLTGKKLLILGNHDKSSYGFYKKCGFKIVRPFEISYNGYRVTFDHYPVDQVDSNRHLHLHGHIHNNGYEWDEMIPYKRNQVNLSVEMTKYKPVHLGRLLDGLIE